MRVARASEAWNRWRFRREIGAIRSTPVLQRGALPLIVLSMVQKRDVLPYLLAVKSFAQHVSAERVVLIADPTIGDEEERVIRRHVPFIEIRRAEEFRRPELPVGGCWERLSAISEYVAEGFVIQLDADTVTLGPVQEVINSAESGRAFTLATDDDFSEPLSCVEISSWAKSRLTGNDHVQVIAEAIMEKLDPRIAVKYVRGCAGFAGFPQKSFGYERLATLSRNMESLIGERWRDWGSEQVASNLLVANIPGGKLLPHASYCAPHRRKSETVFLHFIGFVRFSTGMYADAARAFCQGGDLRRLPRFQVTP